MIPEIEQVRKRAADAIAEAEGFQEQHTHGDRHARYIAANVKQYHQGPVTRESVLEEFDLTEAQREKILEILDDEGFTDDLDHLYMFFLELESSYLHDDWMEGCMTANRAYWEQYRAKIDAGEKTPFPYLNEVKGYDEEQTKRLKHFQLDRMIEHDEELNDALSYAAPKKDRGFFGRSGGWYGIAKAGELDWRIEDVQSELHELDEWLNDEGGRAYDHYTQIAHRLELLIEATERLEKATEGLQLLVTEIEQMARNLDFDYFVKDRILMTLHERKLNIAELIAA